MAQPALVLASSSPFRRALLDKLGLPFECDAPDIDEQARDGEQAGPMVRRLALEKARAVAARHPAALVIGSDQVAVKADGGILGKPGNRATAQAQLQACSGSEVRFETGLCLLDSASGRYQLACETYRVHFRRLNASSIQRYLDREEPYNCAGSFKSEGLGITLFRALEGRDPNTLVGLPLILLAEMLRVEGFEIP